MNKPSLITRSRLKKFLAMIGLISSVAFAQAQNDQGNVAGTVLSEQGEMLAGVSVVATNVNDKDELHNATTDEKGVFTFTKLKIGNTYNFECSYIGYENKTIQRFSVKTGNNSLMVKLVQSKRSLDEVVIIGYGAQKRETVTGSIATIKAEDFNAGQINDPVTLIAGKVAGLNTSNSSRSDPNATADFSLRGPATIQGNSQPLIVIDGVPGGNLQAIAPGDIASIDVLKDGSAAAIYGSRATAGVIIVTTKKGKAGKTQLSYGTYVTTDQVARKYDVLNAEQYRKFGEDNQMAVDDAGADTDWFDEVTRTPVSHSHNLSLSGGSEKTTYYASFNYRGMQGIDLKSDRRFINGTFRLNTKALNDKLDFGILVINSIENKNFANYGAIAQSLNMNPTFPVRNPDGSFYQRQDIQFGLQWNPVASTEHQTNNNKEKKFLGTVNLKYSIIPALSASISYSLIRNDYLSGSFTSREDFFQVRESVGGQAMRVQSNETSNVLEAMLAYDKGFGDHHLNAIAGYSYQNIFMEGFSAGNNNFVTDAFKYYNLGAGAALNNFTPGFNRSGVFVGSFGQERTLVAFFGRAIYNYQERFLLNLSVRHEGASVLGADNKWGTFTGVSAGWMLSKEDFLASSNIVKNLKFRAGYGITGNQESLSPYQSLAAMSSFMSGAQNVYVGVPGTGSWILPYGARINANPLLRWETKKEINIGVDFALFSRGWLSGSLDFYDRRIENLVGNYSAQLPSQILPTIFANAGLMINQGVELALEARLYNSNKFNWTVNFTGAFNRNEIKSITSDQFKGAAQNITRVSEGNNVQRLAPGYPVAVFYGRVFSSLTDEGLWMFRDSEGKEVPASEIGEDDFAYLGNSIPKYSLGLTNSFGFGKFDASILLRSSLGFKALNAKRMFHENKTYFTRNNLFTSAIDRNIKDAPAFSSYFLEDGGFMKLDNLTIGYSVPVKSSYISAMRLYFTGANLLTVTDFSGTDPELGVNYFHPEDPEAETTNGPGVEPNYSYYPNTRSFTVGVNINF